MPKSNSPAKASQKTKQILSSSALVPNWGMDASALAPGMMLKKSLNAKVANQAITSEKAALETKLFRITGHEGSEGFGFAFVNQGNWAKSAYAGYILYLLVKDLVHFNLAFDL